MILNTAMFYIQKIDSMENLILLDMHYGNIPYIWDNYHVFGIILEYTMVCTKVPSFTISSHHIVVRRVLTNVVKKRGAV